MITKQPITAYGAPQAGHRLIDRQMAAPTSSRSGVDRVKTGLIKLENVKDIYVKALDDLVGVNSLFTFAVFTGISFSSQKDSLDSRPECQASTDIRQRLVTYEVAAFSCYLFSSLVAKSLKFFISRSSLDDFKTITNRVMRTVMLLLSIIGSVLGCIFLTVSMVDMIQVKVGTLKCGSSHAWQATRWLVSIVSIALIIYVPFMGYSVYYAALRVQKD